MTVIFIVDTLHVRCDNEAAACYDLSTFTVISPETRFRTQAGTHSVPGIYVCRSICNRGHLLKKENWCKRNFGIWEPLHILKQWIIVDVMFSAQAHGPTLKMMFDYYPIIRSRVHKCLSQTSDRWYVIRNRSSSVPPPGNWDCNEMN